MTRPVARKSLGQHFLHERGILERIVAAADLTQSDAVLEVGPGTGNLTRLLAEQAGRVVAVELDDALAAQLHKAFAGAPHVLIVQGDILRLAPGDLMGDAPYKVVANLPYYITSLALRHLLEAAHPPAVLVLTVQQEVARRIVAQPPDMSLLAVSVQYYAVPRTVIGRIPPGAFTPPPKVDSAVVRLDRRPRPAVDVEPEAFFRTVAAGFSQRRKQLRNSLSAALHLDKAATDAMLRAAGIDPTRRAETLSLAEWGALATAEA